VVLCMRASRGESNGPNLARRRRGEALGWIDARPERRRADGSAGGGKTRLASHV
jgi:hypothetical protein